jgi:chorismate mutase-like protein
VAEFPATKENVHKLLVSVHLHAYALAVVLGLVSASFCPAADAAVASGGDLARLDRLLALMKERLTLMHDVARFKWNAHQPIAAPERERQLLENVVRQGRSKGLEAKFVRSFFEAQIEAARSVEQADFDRWRANQVKPPPGTRSLAQLRRRIDDLNRELLDVLAEFSPVLASDAIQKALPQRAEVLFIGDDLVPVRKTVIGPLRR